MDFTAFQRHESSQGEMRGTRPLIDKLAVHGSLMRKSPTNDFEIIFGGILKIFDVKHDTYF